MRGLTVLIAVLLLPVFADAAEFRELFEREFLTKTWEGGKLEASACLTCHTSEGMKPEYRKIVYDWRQSSHFSHDVSCHNCHGGDPKDPGMSMSHQRGFVGAPKYAEVPEFCGTCHVGILKHYIESGHGAALKTGKGPTCVTCHGAHNVQRATGEIINEKLCSRCHSYERAKVMKQALFETEEKILSLEKQLERLRAEGVYTEARDKNLFSTQAEFRTLFHSIDVSLVKSKTGEFTDRLDVIQKQVQDTFRQLSFRKNFFGLLTALFALLAFLFFRLSGTYRD